MTNHEIRGNVARAFACGITAATLLAKATDDVTETLAQIEHELAATRLGVEGALAMDGDAALAFRKDGRVWRLRVEYPDGRAGLLVNASRDRRLRAVEWPPALVDHLADIAEQKTAVVCEQAGKAERLLELLRAKDA